MKPHYHPENAHASFPTPPFGLSIHESDAAYHRLVKTTPNPRATKNSSGELVPGFPPPLLPEPCVGLAVGTGGTVQSGPVDEALGEKELMDVTDVTDVRVELRELAEVDSGAWRRCRSSTARATTSTTLYTAAAILSGLIRGEAEHADAFRSN